MDSAVITIVIWNPDGVTKHCDLLKTDHRRSTIEMTKPCASKLALLFSDFRKLKLDFVVGSGHRCWEWGIVRCVELGVIVGVY